VSSQIPRRIIQIWGGGEENMSLRSKASAANVRLLNPDFEYMFFDDKGIEEFVDRYFPQYRSALDSVRFRIQRYDFFRYLAIYRLGGFYFDLDVFLAKGISDLVNFGCVFPFEELTINLVLRRQYGMDWEIGNYAFGANAGHPFILSIIENCVKAQSNPNWVREMMQSVPRIFHKQYYVLYTTGPKLVTRTLAEYSDSCAQVKVLFPEDVCDRAYWHRFGSYGVHLQEGSWREKAYFQNKLIQAWRRLRRKRTMKESLRLGPQRTVDFIRMK
jgi:inositol phosphorylceramide mannosyltransferase catalytic subunit